MSYGNRMPRQLFPANEPRDISTRRPASAHRRIPCLLLLCLLATIRATVAGNPTQQDGASSAAEEVTASTPAASPNLPAPAAVPPMISQGAFAGGVEWLNCDEEITLEQLRGKFVLLDFWTYCCINCLQTLPDLKQLEKSYPRQLVVIGVHAPKFYGERDSQNVREAIVRHDILHPVVNDANAVIANRFGVNTWPTVVLIDPHGNVMGTRRGEVTFELLNTFLKQQIPRYRRDLDNRPLRFRLERDKHKPTPLLFPGKVLADATSNRLYIADSGHHRIVVTDLEGQLLDVIGSGRQGRTDGGYEVARFASPQGMAVRDDQLYVADTENHMIRQVDLVDKQVTTIAGTGRQNHRVMVRSAASPRRVSLASPWDLIIHDGDLYIAMAGTHQLWRYELDRKSLTPFAGNGVEDIVDGPLLPRKPGEEGAASFAQPSGFASDGEYLYVADSEGSTVRAVTLTRRGAVMTLLGTAQFDKQVRLFAFGDRDGKLDQALLQHPIGIAYSDGKLYVADTYNNKLKVIDLSNRSIMTWNSSADPSQVVLNEPAGLSIARGKLFIADTNNHMIRVIDLADPRGAMSLFAIRGLKPPDRSDES